MKRLTKYWEYGVGCALAAAERSWLPDWLLRAGIRRLCHQRLRQCDARDDSANEAALQALLQESRRGPIALLPELANEQHYELPAEFFALMLGERRKYSCGLWQPEATNLDQAEDVALNATCEHAQLEDGQEILELGCGWGSLTLWMAARYPAARIVAVSNSHSQRRFIESECRRLHLANVQVLTADINGFSPTRQFDRVVSVEMFEHVRNHSRLLQRIAGWLRPGGKLFVHIFCHRRFAYPFEQQGQQNWMGRHFFSGGMMPSRDWLDRHDDDLAVEQRWHWNGEHYRRTAESWLERLDANRGQALAILRAAYGPGQADLWLQRWRMFLLAVAELFGFAGGTEWYVIHALLAHQGAARKVASTSLAGSLQQEGCAP